MKSPGMTSPGMTRPGGRPRRPPIHGAGAGVVVTGWLVAAWCVAFALANVALEATDRFAHGPYAAYATGLAVMSWIVFALKLVGAGLALSSLRHVPPLPPRVLSTLLWSATALLGLYALGSVVEAIGMLAGVAGRPDQITVAGVLYVVFFLLGATGYGVLAVSFSHRARVGRGAMLIGLLVAPVALALLLMVIPLLLVATHVMPSY
jgi:hypothetical protein